MQDLALFSLKSVSAWTGIERLGGSIRADGGWGSGGWPDELDLYHGTNFKMETVGRYGGVVMIHDLWLDRHPEYSKKMLGQWPSSFKTRQTAPRARKPITVSEFSARELMEVDGLKREHIRVIPNGVLGGFLPRRDAAGDGRVAKTDWVPRLNAISDLFGGADPRKNHQVFLEATGEGAEKTRVENGGPIRLPDCSCFWQL